MDLNYRFIFLWLCILLTFVAGPMQAYGLVLCTGCEDEPGIKFGEANGSCASCPDEDSDGLKQNVISENCDCIDQPLHSNDLVIQTISNHLENVQIAITIALSTLNVNLREKFTQAPAYISPAPPASTLTLFRSVVCLI
ncbi:MAG: hypothetical protein PHC51_05320 [bacterium]|nr:hypothetical protein [bacterium]